MRCPQCQTENSETARFCRTCGSGLVPPANLPTCPKCRGTLTPGLKFCKLCGNPLLSAQPTPAAALPHEARLVCVMGSLQGMSFRIGNGIVLGRAPDVDVVVDEAQISKRHAWVGLDNGRLLARDLQSTNGTYVNDDLANPLRECELHDGDLLVLGKHNQDKFRVCLS